MGLNLSFIIRKLRFPADEACGAGFQSQAVRHWKFLFKIHSEELEE